MQELIDGYQLYQKSISNKRSNTKLLKPSVNEVNKLLGSFQKLLRQNKLILSELFNDSSNS